MSKRVVSMHYTLKNKAGEVLDSSDGSEPLTYLEGCGNIIPGLEKELEGLKKGDAKKVEVKAADAYGEFDKSLIAKVPRDRLPQGKKIKVGDRFKAGSPNEPAPVFTVIAVTDDEVELDGNHPLAGQDLFFDVTIVETRLATEEELEHGHAHGGDGHHHH